MRVERQRLVVEDERLIEIAELARGEAREIVRIGVPGPLLDRLGHVVDHRLPVALRVGGAAEAVVVRSADRRRRAVVQAGDRKGRRANRHRP